MSVYVGKGERCGYLSPPVGSVSSWNHWSLYGHEMVLMVEEIFLMIPQGYVAYLRLSQKYVIIRHKQEGQRICPNSVLILTGIKWRSVYHGIEA